ncbi:MAG: hypothetical protein ACYTFO_10420, partial [Planctomycetota bacterium]
MWIILAAAGTIAIVVALAMWPPNSARVGGENILQSVTEAKEAWLEAWELLRRPVFQTPAGEIAPITEEINTGEMTGIRQAPLMKPNPKAWELLVSAENQLTEALNTYPDADIKDRTIGLQMLARISTLKAFYHRLGAAWVRTRIGSIDSETPAEAFGAIQAVGEAQLTADQMYRDAVISGVHELAATADTETLESLLTEAVAAESATAQQLEGLQRQQGDYEQAIASFNERIAELKGEAHEHRQASRDAATAAAAQTLLERALAAEAEIHDLGNRIVAEERRIQLNQQEQTDLAIQRDAAGTRKQALQDALNHRQEGIGSSEQAGQQARRNLSTTMQTLAEDLQIVSAICQEAGRYETQAIDLYTEALNHLIESEALLQSGGPTAAAEQAELRMDAARVLAGQLRLQQKLDRLQERVAWAHAATESGPGPWELPTYLTDRAAVTKAAQAQLTQAIELFQRAADSANVGDR